MKDFKQNIDSLSNTSGITDFLFALAYWVAVVVIIILIFYIAVKVNNVIKKLKGREIRRDKDNFLD